MKRTNRREDAARQFLGIDRTGSESVTDVDLILMIERFPEVVHVEEIAELVAVGLAHFTTLDQLENHPAKIFGAVNAPAMKHGERHQTKLIEREVADPLEELRAGDVRPVVIRSMRLRAAELLLRATQRGKHEAVGIRVKTELRGGSFLSRAHGSQIKRPVAAGFRAVKTSLLIMDNRTGPRTQDAVGRKATGSVATSLFSCSYPFLLTMLFLCCPDFAVPRLNWRRMSESIIVTP